MMLKRLKQLVIGSAVLPAALAVGSSASAEAATVNSSGPSSTPTTLQEGSAKASAVGLAAGRGGSAGAMSHVRDSWIHDLHLTDHEHYVRHHERLASER
ncbi:MAG TPA: hypothetical protein VK778_06470 [Solirubrobacteraceae bacterium]|jgi:hypothetical protein|nr:hypothetical protein [Solirubrobacteraceae bacterium]